MKYRVKLEWTDKGYILLEDVTVFSKRYKKHIKGFKGELFDGATGAVDLHPLCFIPHDILCRDKVFADGSPCSTLQESFVIYDQYVKYGYWFQARTRFVATLTFRGIKSWFN